MSEKQAREQRQQDRAENRRLTNVTYFIQVGEGGPIEIGFAADVRTRLGELQSSQSEPLRLLAVRPDVPGGEQSLFEQFKAERIEGALFQPSARLLVYTSKILRRRRGTGSIEERGGVFRFKCPDGAGKRFESEWIYRSWDEASQALALYRHKITKRELVPVHGVTLNEYFDETFRPLTEKLRRPGTVKMYKSRWAQIRKAPFANLPLVAITRKQLKQWLRKLKVGRPDNQQAALHAVFSQAIEDDIITANPADDITLEVKKKDEDELRPSPEEQIKLLTCNAVPWEDRLIMMFALGAGLRPGEWRNLELVDVHLDDPVPYVFVQYGTDDRGPTKNGKKRKVPLLGIAYRALKMWLSDVLPTYTLHGRNRFKLVFPTKRGLRRDDNHPFGRYGPREKRENNWHKYLRLAGIERALVPHSLRHGFATNALVGLEGEAHEVWQVQVMLGHERITTTLKYVHPSERDLFDKLGGQSQNGPNPNSPSAVFAAKIEEIFEGKVKAEETGFEPPPTAQGPPKTAPQAVFASTGTDLGLIERARSERARMRAQSFPTLSEAQDFCADVLREHPDATVRAIGRVLAGGPTYLVAFLEVLQALTMAASAADSESNGGAV